MHALTNPKKINQRKLTVLTASLLIIVGFSIWIYATSIIQNHTQLLTTSNLTQKEIWSYEGALQWWKTTYDTTITPLTTIMITFGAITLLGPILWTKIHQ